MTRLRLALMLARTGGLRPWLVFAGSTLGTVFLLAALALPHAHDAQVAREGSRSNPASDAGPEPLLLWRWTSAQIAGHGVLVADVAASAPGAPPPPGATATPRPGEILVSPALARALRGDHGDLLRLGLPGRVVGTLRPGLVSRPGDEIAMVGYRASQLEGIGTPVRTFAPAGDPWAGRDGFDYQVGFTVVLVSILIAVCLFIANVTRVSSVRRDARLAALRLVGMSRRTAAIVVALEAGIASIPGVALGVALALAARASAESWPLVTWPILMRDLTMPGWELAFGCLALPLIAFAGALLAARRAIVSPLAVRRRSAIDRPRARVLLLPLAGWAGLAASAQVGDRVTGGDHAKNLLVIASCGLTAAGLALSGPWLVSQTAAALGRIARSAWPLLGARQLAAHPRLGYRAVAMLVMALFTTTLGITYYGSAVAFNARAAGSVTTATEADRTTSTVVWLPEVNRPERDELARALRAIPGVRSVSPQPRQLVVRTDGHDETDARIQGAAGRAGPGWIAYPHSGNFGGTSLKRQALHDADALLWLIDGLAAVSLVIAGLDGIATRRRAFASLAALGVSPGTLRRAVTLEVIVPFTVAAVTAIAFGVAVGGTLVAITTRIPLTVPWDAIARYAAFALVAALAAAALTALRVAAAVRPEGLRIE